MTPPSFTGKSTVVILTLSPAITRLRLLHRDLLIITWLFYRLSKCQGRIIMMRAQQPRRDREKLSQRSSCNDLLATCKKHRIPPAVPNSTGTYTCNCGTIRRCSARYAQYTYVRTHARFSRFLISQSSV